MPVSLHIAIWHIRLLLCKVVEILTTVVDISTTMDGGGTDATRLCARLARFDIVKTEQPMKKITARQFAAFTEACHRAAKDHDLMRCSSGNISWRVDAERMLVSATRSWLADIRKEQVAVVRLRDGAVLNNCKPSAETPFHAGVLRARPDMNVVLHFQSPCATTLACCAGAEKANFFLTPEIPYYIGAVSFVPFLQPGSEALADAVTAALKTHDMAVLRNHGAVTVGKTFNDAIQKAVFFELACEIVLRAGDRIELMPKQDVELLLRKPGQV